MAHSTAATHQIAEAKRPRIALAPTGRATTGMLACGAASGPIFVAVGLIESLARPGFNLTHNALSALTLGDLGWIQSFNFLVGGALSVIGAVGLHRVLTGGPAGTWAPRLLTIFGIGLMVGGVFHPDPSLGFPPGTPADASAVSTMQGGIHLLSGSTAFIAMIVTCFVLARRFSAEGDRRSAIFSRVAGVLFLAGVAAGGAPGGTLALFIGVSLAWIWVSITEMRLIARASQTTAATS